jgi:hypothetical protein
MPFFDPCPPSLLRADLSTQACFRQTTANPIPAHRQTALAAACPRRGRVSPAIELGLGGGDCTGPTETRAEMDRESGGGSQEFLEKIENKVRNRQETKSCHENGLWIVAEDHGPIFRPQNQAMSLFWGPDFWQQLVYKRTLVVRPEWRPTRMAQAWPQAGLAFKVFSPR